MELSSLTALPVNRGCAAKLRSTAPIPVLTLLVPASVPKGMRVQTVVDELGGEKIDIVKYSDNPEEYVASALSPSKVVSAAADAEHKICRVVVPDFQLSLAIGKEGQNARLAAKLTGWKIDIKSETQARESAEAAAGEEKRG